MKSIKILGTGCAKCKKLADHARTAANELGIEYELEKVTEVNEIMKHGVMMTPGLVIEGEVKSAGKIPDVEAIKKMLASP
ncbi:MAG: TM0996/MTH895 family glutaredoxin-like protein [Phycisphaerales bacterium]|nr:MAG: TM0996/MTH895 family glutaredoxin-like protein [Phycisphaerales bacterium]